MKKPFFSVIIPTHNRAVFLKTAIESVLNQSFDNFEIIVVDDHSSDDTSEVIKKFTDKRIHHIKNTNTSGGAGTRNSGIKMAKGMWIAFLDDDDMWFESRLEQHYQTIEQCGDSCGLVYSGYATYNFEAREERVEHLPKKQVLTLDDLMCSNTIGSFTNISIRADILKGLNGLDERFNSMQDMELYTRIAQQGRIVSIPQKLAYLRVLNTDRISNRSDVKLKSSLLYWKKYENIINSKPILRYRNASRILMLAANQKKYRLVLKVLPDYFAGITIDFSNFLTTLTKTLYILYRKIVIAKFH